MANYRVLPLVVLLASLVLPSTLLGQDAQAEPDAAQMQQLYEQFAKPGKEHEQLRRLVGSWKATVKYYFDESGEATVSEATATYRSLMGGRFVQQRYHGEMQGQKFSGMAITGYDNAKKKYVGIWIDDMGTGIMHSEGTYDVKTHTMTEIAVSSSPTGEMKFKNVTRYLSNDEFIFTMYMMTPDGERKMMDITYKRVEKSPKRKKGQQTESS